MWAYDMLRILDEHQSTARLACICAMAYVPTLSSPFFLGAYRNPVKFLIMVCIYNFSTDTWTQIQFSTGPSARGWATLTYSDKVDRLVLTAVGQAQLHQ